jgi:hypothetical protein
MTALAVVVALGVAALISSATDVFVSNTGASGVCSMQSPCVMARAFAFANQAGVRDVSLVLVHDIYLMDLNFTCDGSHPLLESVQFVSLSSSTLTLSGPTSSFCSSAFPHLKAISFSSMALQILSPAVSFNAAGILLAFNRTTVSSPGAKCAVLSLASSSFAAVSSSFTSLCLDLTAVEATINSSSFTMPAAWDPSSSASLSLTRSNVSIASSSFTRINSSAIRAVHSTLHVHRTSFTDIALHGIFSEAPNTVTTARHVVVTSSSFARVGSFGVRASRRGLVVLNSSFEACGIG